MKARTIWLVGGALGVIGATGLAVGNAAQLDDEPLGEGVVLTTEAEPPTPSASATTQPATPSAPTSGPTAILEPTDATPDPDPDPSDAPTVSAVSPPSAVSAE
ncbi:MAG: hypothetical protein ACK5H2_05305 [Beutenbergiaceae bacterium]